MSRFTQMAEGARAAQAEEEAAAATRSSEQQANESKAAEAQFLQAVQQRDSLQGTFDSLRASQGKFHVAREMQQGGRRALEDERQGAIEARAEDVPTVYELLKTPNDELETDPNEAAYQEQKEAVRNAVKEVRGKKEALQNLGIDVDNLEDQALITAVNQAQEEASAIIREFLVQHPESNIPEALSARGARIGTLEGSLEMLKKREEELGQWGREHIGPYINSSTDPQQLVEGTLTEITRSQEYIDQDKAKLASTEIYRDLLETPGIMEDPVVKSAYERSLAANDEERDLEKKLDAVNRKPTTRFFGYTAEKKAEELAAAKRDLVKAKEEAAPANAAYSAACSSYHERLSAFGDVFSRGDQGKGGYEKKRTELKAKIAEGEQRLASQNQQLESARHYREARQALDLERATQTEELTILKAAAQAAARE